MTEPAVLLGHIRYLLSRRGPLQGRRVVVTAGGTREPIDPVRYLTNHSSGKQGYALAQSALDAGAQVILITTPVSLPVPQGADVIQVSSAAEMESAVLTACAQADVLLMAAAVADFRPSSAADQKIKKASGIPELPLESTPDILQEVSRQRGQSGRPAILVGFAAETQDLLHNAATKLNSKHLDLVVANDITSPNAGFGVDTNRVTLLFPDGQRESLPLQSKTGVAERVIAEVIALLAR